MKILITDIHHGNGGGHATYVLDLLHGFKSHCDLTLASPQTGRLFNRASQIDGVRVLPALYTSRPLPLVAEVVRLRRFLAREKFDLVHVNGSADHRHMMLARMGLSSPPAIVWTKHNTNPIDSFGHRLRARFGTEAAIGVSEYVTAQLQASHYARRVVRTVYHGMDAAYFSPASAAERQDLRSRLFADLPEDAVVFGSTAGTDLEKGWILLVEAAGRLPEALRKRVRVVVAGDLPVPAVMNRIKGKGLDISQVLFPGLVQDVRPILRACDVGFVLSSREAASYALYEAMSVGLPALVSDAGGLPEGVNSNAVGWVVPRDNLDALTHCVRAILGSGQSVLANMGANARQRIKTAFSMPVFVGNIQAVYGQAIDVVAARTRG